MNIGIEKNRTRLLRIVRCWLIFAYLFGAKRGRVLPRRLGAWVCAQIFKAEKAAYFLRVASGVFIYGENMPVEPQIRLTIEDAITRLKAVKTALNELRVRTRCLRVRAHVENSRRDSFATNEQAVFGNTGSRKIAIVLVTCRAPPSFYAEKL